MATQNDLKTWESNGTKTSSSRWTPRVDRRSAGLAFALVLAVLGTLALFAYVRGLEGKALSATDPIGVLVAKTTIPRGTGAEAAASRGLVTVQKLPRKAIVAGAATSVDDLRGRVAAVDILPGEQVISSRFVSPSQSLGLLPIPKDRQAMAVEVGVPTGAGGFVQPGDHVSVMAQAAVSTNGGGETRVQFLLQNVEVLAVGQRVVTTDRAAGAESDKTVQPDQTSRVLLTLAVLPAEAEKLAFAVMQGEIYVTLLPPGQAPASTAGRTSANLFS